MKTQQWRGAVEGWSGYLRAAGMSRRTIATRQGGVNVIANNTIAAAPADITGDTLIELASSRPWSNDYRRSFRTSAHQFFSWCISNGLHPGPNPADELPKVPESAPAPRPVPDDMWVQLLAAADERCTLMARLAAEAGLRRAEVAVLHRRDLLREPDGWSLLVHGKGDKQRIVPITDTLAESIRSYRSGYTPKGFLFPGNTDGHLSPEHVGVLITRLLPPGWSMHKLRHRYASRGFAGTGNIRAVQEALGHASVATTQRYTAVSARDVRQVSESAA